MKEKKAKAPRKAAEGIRRSLTIQIPLVIICAVTAVIVVMCAGFNLLSRNTVSDLVGREIQYVASENTQKASAYLRSMDAYAESLGNAVQNCQSFGRAVAEPAIVQSLKSTAALVTTSVEAVNNGTEIANQTARSLPEVAERSLIRFPEFSNCGLLLTQLIFRRPESH